MSKKIPLAGIGAVEPPMGLVCAYIVWDVDRAVWLLRLRDQEGGWFPDRFWSSLTELAGKRAKKLARSVSPARKLAAIAYSTYQAIRHLHEERLPRDQPSILEHLKVYEYLESAHSIALFGDPDASLLAGKWKTLSFVT